MKYLDAAVYSAIQEREFLNTKPFPFLNPQGAIKPEMFLKLHASMPDIGLFTKTVGMERKYGQKPHDRYELKYSYDLTLSPAWKEFISELYSAEYQNHIARIFGIKHFVTRVQWQYAYSGCSVSPHCDSRNKIGSQIFYFNTPDDWKDEWGGKTLVLDDHGTKDWRSAPELSEFDIVYASEIVPNRSLLFKRSDHSWHAVEELRCPPGALRKLFTVIFDKHPSLYQKIGSRISGILR